MSRISSLILALAVGQALAMPTEPVLVIEKRQSGGLAGLLSGLKGKGGAAKSTGTGPSTGGMFICSTHVVLVY